MNASDAVAALRELADLPSQRRAELARRAVHAPTDADRARLVYRARAEAESAREEHERQVSEDYAARLAAMAEREASQDARDKPQTPGRRRYADPDGLRYPDARPVTVRYTTPRRPEAERVQVRREGIGMNHAQRIAEREQEQQVPAVVLDVNPKTGAPLAHGSNGYRVGCRCSECKAGKKLSRTPKGTRRPNGERAPHGTLTRYKTCRCDECRTAAVNHAREYRARKSVAESGRL